MTQRLTIIGLLILLLTACAQLQPPNQSPLGVSVPSKENLPTESDHEEPAFDFGSSASGSGTTLTNSEHSLPTGLLEIGNADAPLLLLVVTNHFCAYCREFQEAQFPRLMHDFIEPGMLKIQIAILPLKKYPQSSFAAGALLCAVRDGKGLAMHELLSSGTVRDLTTLLAHAKELKLDPKKLRACTSDVEITQLLDQQKSILQSLGVTSVPTFFLNGQRFVGLPNYPELRGRIEQALSR